MSDIRIIALGKPTHAGMEPDIHLKFAMDVSKNPLSPKNWTWKDGKMVLAGRSIRKNIADYLKSRWQWAKNFENQNNEAYNFSVYVWDINCWEFRSNVYTHKRNVDGYRSNGRVNWNSWAQDIVNSCAE